MCDCVFGYFTTLSLEVERRRRESTYGSRVNPSEIGYSPGYRADLPELGYSPDGPLNKLIKPKCPNTSHMYSLELEHRRRESTLWLVFGHFGLINLVTGPSRGGIA